MSTSSNLRFYVSLLLCLVSRALDADDFRPPAQDKAIVANLVYQLGTANSADREKAGAALEDLPDWDLGLIDEYANQKDLKPETKRWLDHLLKRINARDKMHLTLNDRYAKIAAWPAKQATAHYGINGHTNPSWDAAAKKAIQLDGRRSRRTNPSETISLYTDEQKALESAISAGCDDPDVLAIEGSFLIDTGASEDKAFAVFRKALDVPDEGKVSPYAAVSIFNQIVRGRAAGYDGGINEQTFGSNVRILGDMVGNYRAALELADTPPDAKIEMAENVMGAGMQMHIQLKKLFDDVYPPLEQALPNDSRVLGLKGSFYVNYAWEARGSGNADTVTPQGWKDFGERLKIAEAVLSKAWDLDHTNPVPPTQMLRVALGLEKSRDEMETWFKRAMDADPDNYEACSVKLNYLEPKWYGDRETALKFARECFEGRDWHKVVAFILLDLHEDLAKSQGNTDSYYQDAGVWSDISAVYSAFLAAYPDDYRRRSNLAYYACLSERWATANKLFKRLGDHMHSNLCPDEKMKEFRIRAAEVNADPVSDHSSK